MAQIMEFLLNLLLFRGKFLTTTAAESFHKAIKKCLQLKRKISMEFTQATQTTIPFENMLDFINYNSTRYSIAGQGCIVTADEVTYKLFEKLGQKQKQGAASNLESYKLHVSGIDSKVLEKKKIPNGLQEKAKFQKKDKIRNEDYILDNLNAILKSQEFLLKNIIKLVKLLEKDSVLEGKNEKIAKLKTKLSACKDILSSTTKVHKSSNVVDKLIEEEVTRCRFSHGESRTSREISLKAPKLEGIEAVLDKSTKDNAPKQRQKPTDNKIVKQVLLPQAKTVGLNNNRANEVLRRHLIDLEARINSEKFLKLSKSEPELAVVKYVKSDADHFEKNLKQIQMDIVNCTKLIEANEKHFIEFEDMLWHSLTGMKFMALRDEYLNSCKCAFYNKRQFLAIETEILKRIERQTEVELHEKFTAMGESLEQKLREELKQKQVDTATDVEKLEISTTIQAVANNELPPLKEISSLKEAMKSAGTNPLEKLKNAALDVDQKSETEVKIKADVLLKQEQSFKETTKDMNMIKTERENKSNTEIQQIENNIRPVEKLKMVDNKTIKELDCQEINDEQRNSASNPKSAEERHDIPTALTNNENIEIINTIQPSNKLLTIVEGVNKIVQNVPQVLEKSSLEDKQQENHEAKIESVISSNKTDITVESPKTEAGQGNKQPFYSKINNNPVAETITSVNPEILSESVSPEFIKEKQIVSSNLKKNHHEQSQEQFLIKSNCDAIKKENTNLDVYGSTGKNEEISTEQQKNCSEELNGNNNSIRNSVGHRKKVIFDQYMQKTESKNSGFISSWLEKDNETILKKKESKMFDVTNTPIMSHLNYRKKVVSFETPSKKEGSNIKQTCNIINCRSLAKEINDFNLKNTIRKDKSNVEMKYIPKNGVENCNMGKSIMKSNETQKFEDTASRVPVSKSEGEVLFSEIKQEKSNGAFKKNLQAGRNSDQNMFSQPSKYRQNIINSDVLKKEIDNFFAKNSRNNKNIAETKIEDQKENDQTNNKLVIEADKSQKLLLCLARSKSSEDSNNKPSPGSGETKKKSDEIRNASVGSKSEGKIPIFETKFQRKAFNNKHKTEGDNQADLVEVNQKVFADLELTLQSVKILSSSDSPKDEKPVTKTKTENCKIDEQAKKSISTKDLVNVIKQRTMRVKHAPHLAKKKEESVFSGDDKTNKIQCDVEKEIINVLEEASKVTSNEDQKHVLSNEKSKTFFKSSPETAHLFSPENAQKGQTDIKVTQEKGKTQMRRTTKAAMKKQQVLTILPKLTKQVEEKRKPQVRPIESNEVKGTRSPPKNNKSGIKTAGYGSKRISSAVKTIFPQKNISRNLQTDHPTKRAPNCKINFISWREEDDSDTIITIFKD